MGGKQTKEKKASNPQKGKTNATGNAGNATEEVILPPTPRRISTQPLLTDVELKSILITSINNTQILSKELSAAVKEKFMELSQGKPTVSIEQLTKLPEFGIHPLFFRMFQVCIDILENPVRTWSGGGVPGLNRTTTHKSSQFYGCTFTDSGSLGIVLKSVASNGKGVLVGNILPGRLASKGGVINVGDHLVSINSRNTEFMDVIAITQLIGSVGRPLRLRFKKSTQKGNKRSFRFAHSFGNGRIGLGLNEYKNDPKKPIAAVKSGYGGQYAPFHISALDQTSGGGRGSGGIPQPSKVYVSDVAKGTQAFKAINPTIQKHDLLMAVNEIDVSTLTQKQVLQCISQATRPVNMQFYRVGDAGGEGGGKDGDGKDRSLLTWQTTQHLNDNDGLYGTKSNPAQTISLTYQVRQNDASSKNQASLNVVLAACVVCSSSTLNPSLARVKDAVMFRMYDVSGRLVWFVMLFFYIHVHALTFHLTFNTTRCVMF